MLCRIWVCILCLPISTYVYLYSKFLMEGFGGTVDTYLCT